MKTEGKYFKLYVYKDDKEHQNNLKSIAILRIFSIAMLVNSAKVYRGFNLSYFALFLLDNHVNRMINTINILLVVSLFHLDKMILAYLYKIKSNKRICL